MLDPENDPRQEREIKILDTKFDIVQKGKKKNWYFVRPLVQDKSGKPQVYGGVEYMAVQSPSKTKIELFNDKGFRTEEGKKLPMPDNEGKSLEEFIKLILRLKTGKDESGIHYPRNEDFVNANLFSAGEHIGKFLIIAEWAGLWNTKENRMGTKFKEKELFKAKAKSPKSVKLSGKKLAGFYKDQYIRNWLDANPSEDKTSFHRDMANALEILNISPSDLAMETGIHKDLSKAEKLKKFKKLLLKLRYWSENPNAENPATWQERKIQDGDGVLTGNRFNPHAKLLGVDPESLNRLSTDKNPIIEQEDHDGAKGKWKKGQTLVSDRNNSVMYKLVKVLRHFFAANVIGVSDQPKTDSVAGKGESVLSQEAIGVGQYPDVKMSWKQQLAMRDCLLKGAKANGGKGQKIFTITKVGKFPATQVSGTFDITKDYGGIGTKYSVKSFWYDAYFLFMLASTALGGRAEELFDIIAEPPEDKQSSGVLIDYDEKPPMYIVYVYTRKTEKSKAGKIHQAILPNSPDADIVKDMIDDRLEDIKKKIGIITTIPPQYKGGKPRPNALHALIGVDGKYTRIDTINLPTDQVHKQQTARRIIFDILRHCYEVAGITHKFFYDRPVHALRHVFAHYWLKKSGYDYDLVMTLGHWQNRELLEGSYGEPDPALFLMKLNKVANVDPSKTHEEIALQKEQPSKKTKPRERVYRAGKKPKPELTDAIADIMNKDISGKEDVGLKKSKTDTRTS